jgi:hypothetical protein
LDTWKTLSIIPQFLLNIEPSNYLKGGMFEKKAQSSLQPTITPKRFRYFVKWSEFAEIPGQAKPCSIQPPTLGPLSSTSPDTPEEEGIA